MARTFLYRFFDRDGRLLYIGITSNFVSRLAQHESKVDWFKDIARIELVHFEARDEALVAEGEEIQSRKPIYNVKPGKLPADARTTLVRLNPNVMARIDALEGPGRRAQFIRDAVRRKLDSDEATNDTSN